jgi:hypothetical protein
LYLHLPANESELVLFDINRANDLHHFIVDNERAMLHQLQEGQATQFSFTLVTNDSGESRDVQAHTRVVGKVDFSAEDLHSRWPSGVYSLSHVAIPFEKTDPWYGGETAFDGEQVLSIGAIAPRGEQGLLTVPSAQFMRLRHNPFFDYVAERTRDFCTVCRSEQADGEASQLPD